MQTPAQTLGPYFHLALGRKGDNVLAGEGSRVRIEGRVLDGDRRPIGDALIEVWQANAAGRYRHPLDRRSHLPLDESFRGFGRAATDDDGAYWFDTVKPGAVEGQAPHLAVIVQARGVLRPCFTRIYFADEAEANAGDPVLQAVPADRRGTLIAERVGDDVHRFDVRFQGDDETVFLVF